MLSFSAMPFGQSNLALLFHTSLSLPAALPSVIPHLFSNISPSSLSKSTCIQEKLNLLVIFLRWQFKASPADMKGLPLHYFMPLQY